MQCLSRGTKIMQLKAGNTIFRDSVLHLPGSLSNLAKAFDLPLMKGVFPHLFNSVENYDYEGPLPDKKYFDLTFTAKTEKDLEDFDKWHDERSKTPWNFKHELEIYCKDDVKILALIMLNHHNICYEKFGLSPWHTSTAPSYCHKVIKEHLSKDIDDELPDDDLERRQKVDELAWDKHWAVLLPQEYWYARNALIGGKTDAKCVHYRLSDEEVSRGVQIKYQDIVSMYPFVQASSELVYPVGLPRIKIYDPKHYPCGKHQNPKTGNKLILCSCPLSTKKFYGDRLVEIEEILVQPSLEYMTDPATFGIATVTMIPPTNLFHPVLVVWDENSGRRVGTLEPIIEQTFTLVEIQLAISKRYKLVKVHRIDLYHTRPALWADFVKDLYIEKLANSGPTPSPEEQERIVAIYEERFGIGEKIKESFPRWEFKSALRLVFKIMLNSGWGKHCQRPNMPKMSLIHYDDAQEMTSLYSNIDKNIVSLSSMKQVGEKTLFKTKPTQHTSPNFHDSYLPAGLFVPAYGRIMLYKALDILGTRVLYHDTDSVMYIYDPELENIPTGDIWGEWDEEKISKNGNISAFVGLGAKSYAIEARDGKNVIKLKGLTIKHSHKDLINFKSLEKMVLERLPSMKVPQRNFVYTMGQGIHIEERLKKLTFDPACLKGYLHTDNRVYPPGYCQGCLELSEEHTC
jgi:DNA polymerase type B, organellar and viral